MKKAKRAAAWCIAAVSVFTAGCTSAESSTGDPEVPDISVTETVTSPAVTTAPETTASTAQTTDASSAEESSLPEQTEPDPFEELYGLLPEKDLEKPAVKRLMTSGITPVSERLIMPSDELFGKRYGGSIENETVIYSEQYNRLSELIAAGKSPDIFPTEYSALFPKGVISGLFMPADELIDFSSELWKDTGELSSFYTFNGRMYAAAVEAVPEFVCFYNTRAIEENELPDPAELYAQGEWTYEAFEEMCRRFNDKEKDKSAFDGYLAGMALSESCGVPLVTVESGRVVSNLEDERLASVEEWIYSLGRKGYCFDRSSNNWLTRGSGKLGEGMAEGSNLFLIAALSSLWESKEQAARFGDVSNGEVMFVPMPRSADGQHHMSVQPRGYFLCSGSENTEGAAVYLNCLKAARDLDLEAAEDILANEYGWTVQMLEMQRSCRVLAVGDPVIDCVEGMPREEQENLFYDTLDNALLPDDYARSWEETVEAVRKQINYAVMSTNDPEPIGP